MPTIPVLPSAWSMDPEDILLTLRSSSHGLTSSEALQRLEQNGKNIIGHQSGNRTLTILINQFKSPLVIILIIASLISALLGETTQTGIVLSIIVFSSLLGFIQEFRSEKALQKLQKQLKRTTTVIRNGKPQTVKSEDIVVGDIVLFELGSIIPADLRLYENNDLELDESNLTGESEPVSKTKQSIDASKKSPQDLTCMLFAGTHVVQGSGKGIVVAVGSATMFGKTADLLSSKTDETSFQKGLHDFGNFLLKITLVLTVCVFALLGLIHGNWGESLLFSLALAVGISPELLPVIVTINLSRGALAMSKKFVLVKRLSAIEDIGNTTVFCTDKTGTLTIGKIRVRESVDIYGKPSPITLTTAKQCLDINDRGKASNSIDQALFEAVAEQSEQQKLIDIIAFDFTRRRMSCIRETNVGRKMITKGAITEVLNVCNTLRDSNGKVSSINAKVRKEIELLADSFHDRGYRALAIAEKPIGTQSKYTVQDEYDLECIGFVLLSDAPKETANKALKELQALAVRIVILTGDNERVTRYVAEQLNFKLSRLLIGDEIDEMNDAQLQTAVKNTDAFAQITPAHKLRIVTALKKRGEIVGFMGDGINDAPALRAADVGISFESATDVAKEAASIILLRKNLSVLAEGIREGRRTFINTRTYIRATIASNFGNMISVAGAALLLPFIPLLPAQILLLNLLTDLPMLAISTDNVSNDDIKKPKRWDIKEISNFMYYFGSISSLADYTTFAVLLFVVQADMQHFRSAWFIESTLTELIVIFLLRSYGKSWKSKPSKILVIASTLVIGIAIFMVQTQFGSAFEFVPLHGITAIAIALIVIGYAGLTELGKHAYVRFKEKTAG
ncbi:magnesium-translocating P-type ATPase [Candidatus Uhrbacteria bacterium]|nr:magnesium-translocating P-type ATPase [Candidatus Uhrbacteria bacterium]